ncbi:MAG: hypothetical protein SF052_10395 [Bacteroidia bacterium]|nr:hypothetical protein [Bacteroidia bacterium]
MKLIDFPMIVAEAWKAYDPKLSIKSITDISAKVSTNHVYMVKLQGKKRFVVAKLSYFGKYEHFREDHTIINVLANTLPKPYHKFLAHSLLKDGEVFTYRFKDEIQDVWVVFYQAVPIKQKMPRRLEPPHIQKLGQEIALFHEACAKIIVHLPPSSKTVQSDIIDLMNILDTGAGKFEYRLHIDQIKRQCELFLSNTEKIGYNHFLKLPVFVDWNIGNFSIRENGQFYSRWDYDWFRMASRVLDFYFFSRVVSDAGDRTVFSYLVSPLMEDRFLMFLKAYHKIYPLSEAEVRFIKEAFRFFILNYVVKYGKHFFHSFYAAKLQKEAYELYLPVLDEQFDADYILRALKI